MRKLVLALLVVIVSASAPARAEGFAIGLFVGEPLGVDLDIGLQRRSALDIVIGATTIRNGRVSYGHLTYLYTLHVAEGQSVRVPLRLGFGGAVFDLVEDDNVGLAARVPFELGIRFRRSPIEIYGEITFVLQLIDKVDPSLDGGVGLRIHL
jgi:hypothetical protein